MKIKTSSVCLALGLGLATMASVIGLTGCFGNHHAPVSDRTTVSPTFSDDEHAMPVYTSPTTAPATNDLMERK